MATEQKNIKKNKVGLLSKSHHLLKALLWLIMPIILTIESGCGYGYYRDYHGPKRPLNEVAILVASPTVMIDKIDGGISFRQSWREVHLPPGEHSIKAHYYDTLHNLFGEPITKSEFFIQGYVYEVEISLVNVPYSYRSGDIGGERMRITRLGTIEEEAKKPHSRRRWRKYVESLSGDQPVNSQK